jgi:hypothetical protein
LLAPSCASAPQPRERSFTGEERVAPQGDGFSVELVRVTYLPRSVAVRIRIRDQAPTREPALGLHPTGILLAIGRVEIPPSPHRDLPGSLAMPRDGWTELTLHYAIGRPLEIGAELVVRGLRRGAPSLPVSLPFPGRPHEDVDLEPELEAALDAEVASDEAERARRAGGSGDPRDASKGEATDSTRWEPLED